MFVPLEKLRVRIGLPPDDTSKDAELTDAWAIAWAITERYLNRKLSFVDPWVEQFTHFAGYILSLERYPVCSIELVYADGRQDPAPYHADLLKGLIQFDGRVKFHELQIRYAGGYDEDGATSCVKMPDDLLLAIQLVFDGVYEDGAGGAVSSENVQSITINDVGTIRWSSTGEYGGSEAVGFVPARSAAILNSYRRELC